MEKSGLRSTQNRVLVTADIMRGEYFYATFRMWCRKVIVGNSVWYDVKEFYKALYKKYPSVENNTKFSIKLKYENKR